MSEQDINLTDLLNKINQLEERLNVIAKYVPTVKQQLDIFISDYKIRPEVQKIELLEMGNQQLFSQFNELREQISNLNNPVVVVSDSTENIKVTEAETPTINNDDSENPAMTEDEFWEKYNDDDQRDFTGVNLQGIFFSGTNLRDVDFTRANLQQSALNNCMFLNLQEANLRDADLMNCDL
ncbi:MAG TPA: pentapeptide repeat-containing protein, partial [Allocoleopsis sp.]